MEQERSDRIWDLLDIYKAPRVSEGFTSSVLTKIRAEEVATRMAMPASAPARWRVGWRLVAGLAASLLVALTLGILWRRSPEPDTRRTAPPPDKAGPSVTDEQIIRNLEIYENVDLLQNLYLLSDLEVVENLDKSPLQGNTTGHEK